MPWKPFIRVWDNSPEPLPVVGASEVRWNRFNPSLSRVWNWAIASPEKLDFAQAELIKEIHALAADGLTDAEIERARKTWTGKQAMQHQHSAGMAQVAALDELYGLGCNHSTTVLDRVRAISPAEVRSVCARYFTAAPLVVRVGQE